MEKVSLRQKIANIFKGVGSLRQSNPKVFFLLIGCIVLVIIFLFTAVFFYATQDKTNTSQTPYADTGVSDQFINPLKRKPTFLRLEFSKKRIFHVNDDIMLVLVGDSSGQTIRGYDAVFQYNKSLVSYTSSQNLYPAFQYQYRPRDSWVIITAAQKLNENNDVVLKNTKLMEFHFKALRPGVAYFPMSFVTGRLNDSNLIDQESSDILTKANGLVVQIVK